jgi:hypothetical protein
MNMATHPLANRRSAAQWRLDDHQPKTPHQVDLAP